MKTTYKKWVVALLHIAVWALLFSLPFLLRSYEDHRPPQRGGGHSNPSLHYFINNLYWIGFFYLNAQVLIPRLVYKRKFWLYGIVLCSIFCLWLVLGWLTFLLLRNPDSFHWQTHILFTFFIFLFFFACSTAYRTFRDKIISDQVAQERENENLKTELTLLRSQVSPHFMFNVLNNMVALARKKSDLLEPSLIKLSSLMRYMLYESDEEKVYLEREIEYLQSYIDLQQQRFGNNVKVNVSMDIADNYYQIEPMLLIPFVENAFKHGTGLIDDAIINIQLKAEEGLLRFSVGNKYVESADEVKDKTSGIGLPNVQRRLNLLYGNNHRLFITKENNWFEVKLEIKMTNE
ncbi:histidine kinase [Chitinophagaceae bacterium LB-8]|uniref:Histidine kinase n=1 Tax=Paraflavisolibacter caeni TaxID=2982496 RepID=A0A9X2XXB2_9BACT|nr:histidine kinase [Paraflavisolibacter caeni]MCU7550660.1 histidine kinase [Paraflavisolibacter caeni]